MIHWSFERVFTVNIVLLTLNKTNKESPEGVNITKIYKGGWYNWNNPSTTNESNVETSASESTITAEYVQTPGTLMDKINNEPYSGANKINNESSAGSNIKTIRRVWGITEITHQHLIQYYLMDEVMLRLVIQKSQ